MKKLLVLLVCLPILLASCTKDNATISLTFKKGTAVYADIEEVRSVELVSTPRMIENAGKLFIGENYILIGENGKGIFYFICNNTHWCIAKFDSSIRKFVPMIILPVREHTLEEYIEIETIILELPEGRFVDDFDSLSVWCVDFQADFGNLRLTAP